MANRFDVNGDSAVSPADLINFLHTHVEHVLSGQPPANALLVDVSGEMVVSVLDVAMVLEVLNGEDGIVLLAGRNNANPFEIGGAIDGRTGKEAIRYFLSFARIDLGPIDVDAIHIRMHGGSDAAFATGAPVSIWGGAGGDVIYGSREHDDFLDGGAGNDSINGQGGADEIYGGEGDDWLQGDGFDQSSPGDVVGADRIYGGPGDDNINGNGGNDEIYAGLGNDTVEGGPGEDLIYGDNGTDDDDNALDGNDTLYGGNRQRIAILGAPGKLAPFNDRA